MRGFQSITITYPLPNDPMSRSFSSPGVIEKLLSFFDADLINRESPRAGGWKIGVALEFIRADGSQLRIVMDSHYRRWCAGAGGDWPVEDPGLQEYLRSLMGREPDVRGR